MKNLTQRLAARYRRIQNILVTNLHYLKLTFYQDHINVDYALARTCMYFLKLQLQSQSPLRTTSQIPRFERGSASKSDAIISQIAARSFILSSDQEACYTRVITALLKSLFQLVIQEGYASSSMTPEPNAGNLPDSRLASLQLLGTRRCL